eukprot:756199-Hanusia_phi.AAC.2
MDSSQLSNFACRTSSTYSHLLHRLVSTHLQVLDFISQSLPLLFDDLQFLSEQVRKRNIAESIDV